MAGWEAKASFFFIYKKRPSISIHDFPFCCLERLCSGIFLGVCAAAERFRNLSYLGYGYG